MSVDVGPDLPEIRAAAVFGLARSGRAAVDGPRRARRRGRRHGREGRRRARRRCRRSTACAGSSAATPRRSSTASTSSSSRPGSRSRCPIFDAARARAIPVVSEIELASRLLPGVVVGITGTNGKSTTTALAAALLRAAGHDAVACGNFGTPWISFATKARRERERLGPEDVGRRALVLPARGHPAVRARRRRPPEPHARPPRPLPLDGRLRRREGADLREPARGAGRRPQRGRPARRADPAARPALRVLAGTRSRRSAPWLKDDLFVADVNGKGPRVIAKRSDLALPGRAQRRERARGARGDAAARRHAGAGRRDVPRLPRPAPPHGPRADARRRHVVERLEGDERRRDAEEPRGLRRRARPPHPRRQGQGRRLRPPRAARRRRRPGRSSRSARPRPRSRRRSRSIPGVDARRSAGTLEKAVEEAARRAAPGDVVLLLARVRVVRPVPQLRAPRRGVRAARRALCPSPREGAVDGQEAGLRPPPLRLGRPPRRDGPPHDLQRVGDADLPPAVVGPRGRVLLRLQAGHRRRDRRRSSRSPRCRSTTAGSTTRV